METKNLLIEIGAEELPPKALLNLSTAFAENVTAALEKAGLDFSATEVFATPRRLGLIVKDLQTRQPDQQIERRGPAVKAAFDKDGTPTKAALGFAKSCGVSVEQLDTLETDKGTWLSFSIRKEGKKTEQLLPEIVITALDRLPIPKRMRWGDLDVEFVRPVHWVLLLFGQQVIETTIYSIETGNKTYGHRFHAPGAIEINQSSEYEQSLLDAKVIPSFTKRRAKIVQQLEKLAKKNNATVEIDSALLDEVTAMVEWPVALVGNFSDEFLSIPAETIVSALKYHQKSFCMTDQQGKLLPHFITVSNIESKDPDQVRMGNERVIRPRLADAMFFWQQDKKQPLAERVELLKSVVFQNKLGSLYDKSKRIQALGSVIGAQMKLENELVTRAAALCKCDLMTEMVGEFPELQGIMGRYYALHDGENPELALALQEYYRPRFSGDSIPSTALGQALSLADRIDTLIGIFGIGETPSGDKDPFGLRRAALGCIRILIEANLALNLKKMLDLAFEQYQRNQITLHKETPKLVYDFILARLHTYYIAQGISQDIIDSVVCLNPEKLNDMDKRIKALVAFRQLPESQSLAAANKRISNILKKSNINIKDKFDHQILEEKSEKSLASKLDQVRGKLAPLFDKADYEKAMKLLAGLKTPVDDFFDNVMVMDENETLRDNRLALLKSLRDQFLKIADISKLQH